MIDFIPPDSYWDPPDNLYEDTTCVHGEDASNCDCTLDVDSERDEYELDEFAAEAKARESAGGVF